MAYHHRAEHRAARRCVGVLDCSEPVRDSDRCAAKAFSGQKLFLQKGYYPVGLFDRIPPLRKPY